MQAVRSATLAKELQPRMVAGSAVSGALLFVIELGFTASFAALVYAEATPEHLAEGIGLVAVGNAILIAIIALFSTYRGALANCQDLPAAVMGLAAGNLAVAGTVNFPTLVVMVFMTTVLAGVVFVLLGTFKLGNLVRFLPYPVMGGFLAGTGYLLVAGGIDIVTGSNSSALLTPEALVRWLPALALGLALLLARRHFANPVWLPGLVLVAVGLFFAGAAVLGQSIDELTAEGWLVGSLQEAGLWQLPISPTLLAQTDWSAILSQMPVLLPMILMSAIGMLLNTNALELIIKRDLNLNRELVITGAANIVSGFGGSLIGYHSISTSSLNYTLAPNRRLPGVILSLMLLTTAILGAPLIGLIPKMVLGGLVIFVGLMFLAEWVYDAWFKFPRPDFIIILLILVIIAWQGFLVGVIVGFVAALVMFVFSYSRTDVVRHADSGASYRSRITRSPASVAALADLCLQIYILRLQGYIFFGTANTLLEKVRGHIQSDLTRFVIFDFAHVSGLDSTALLSFEKMRLLAAEQGITLILTGMSPALRNQIVRGGFAEKGDAVRFFPTLDGGVGWCENELLKTLPVAPEIPDTLEGQLDFLLPGGSSARLIPYLTRLTTAEGDVLIQQGDAPDYLYFIESGQVTAQLQTATGAPTRLETMQGGRVVGELGFYLGTLRTASVVVDEAGVVYRLSRDDLTRMQTEDPAALDALQRIIIRLISERLVQLTRAFQAQTEGP